MQATSLIDTAAPASIEPSATAEPAASGAGQEPSPAAAPSDSTSIGDESSMFEAQASSESQSSGKRTSSGAGAHETMPTGQGLAASVPVSTGKAKATKVGFSSVYTVACAHLMSVPKLSSAAAQTCLVLLLTASLGLLSSKGQSQS